MSAVVSAVKSVVSAAFKVVQTVGKVVVDTVQRVGRVVENTVKFVGNAVESIAKIAKPLLENYAIQLALMAAGIPPVYAAPMSAGMGTLARGGSVEDALKSAATVAVVQNVQTSVYKGAVAAGYSTTQAAAAASAASSAVSTAAAGGNIEDVLKGAVIGGAAGAAGSQVLNSTKSVALANFTRSAVVSALQGQQLKQAILNGASAAAVGYLQQIQEEQKRGDELVAKRDQAYEEYKNKVNEYNNIAEQYNNSTSQQQADSFKAQLDKLLPEINTMATNIGAMNQQLADIQAKINETTKKAEAETGKSLADFTTEITETAKTAEEELLAQIQEAAGREFGPATSEVQLAQYTPTATDTPLKIDIAGLGRTIYEDDRVSINEYGSMFDSKTGEYLGDLTEDQLLQLRQKLGLPTEQSNIIGETPTFGGATGEPGSMIGPVGEGGTDTELLNTQVKELMLQQQFFQDQIVNTQEEITRLQSLKSELETGIEQISPANRGPLQDQITQVENEINRLTDIKNTASEQSARASENLAQVEQELAARTETETARSLGRIERQTAAELARYERDQANFERELARLEAEIAQAEDEAQRARVRQEFVTGQRQRLGERGRLTGTLQEQIDAELNDLLDQYESARGRATEAAADIEAARPAPQRPGGQGITDQEVIDLLGLGEEEAARYGFVGGGEAVTGGTGAGAGAGGEGEGGPAPEEEAPAEAPAEETAQRFDAQGRPIFATATVRPEGATPTREAAPAISPRVTGEALVGILGEKEPLFGGDEDQQRAVWNRRSLRLRRALGL